MKVIVDRHQEQEIMKMPLKSDEAEFLAMYGRRVGKTFLINNAYEKEIIFQVSGGHGAGMLMKTFALCISIR